MFHYFADYDSTQNILEYDVLDDYSDSVILFVDCIFYLLLLYILLTLPYLGTTSKKVTSLTFMIHVPVTVLDATVLHPYKVTSRDIFYDYVRLQYLLNFLVVTFNSNTHKLTVNYTRRKRTNRSMISVKHSFTSYIPVY